MVARRGRHETGEIDARYCSFDNALFAPELHTITIATITYVNKRHLLFQADPAIC
jgi:hypothetical protein